MVYDSLVIYTDAASRGNPGRASIAYRIFDSLGKEVTQNKKFLGDRVGNNTAEYKALLAALDAASKLSNGNIQVNTDSERVVKQMTGKEKSKKLKLLFEEVKQKEKLFRKVSYSHKRREDPMISSVDKMANEVLDMKERSRI